MSEMRQPGAAAGQFDGERPSDARGGAGDHGGPRPRSPPAVSRRRGGGRGTARRGVGLGRDNGA